MVCAISNFYLKCTGVGVDYSLSSLVGVLEPDSLACGLLELPVGANFHSNKSKFPSLVSFSPPTCM